jgi:hypothetical protein
MQRNARILCHLALGWLSLCYFAGAQAIPTGPSELLDGTQPLPDFSAVAQPPEQAAPPVISAGSASAGTSPAATPRGETAAAAGTDDDGEATATIPCLISFADEESVANSCDDGTTPKSLSVQFGQRMGSDNDNILVEFDGIRVDYHLSGGLKLNGVVGYPVLSDQDKFNAARQVFGLSANTAKFAHAWDLNSYLIEQQDNGEAKRHAGGAIRYLRSKRSLLLLLDYDMASSSLDAFTASGALRLPRSTTLSATVDMRNSPLRWRQQKYLQQTMATTEGWTWNLPMDRITHYTRDLSEEVTTLAVELTHSFSSRLKMTGSAAMLDVSSTSGVDDGSTAPSEYFYHLQLSGSDLMFSGNNNVLDLSHRITDSVRSSSATLDTRYAINRRWKVSPRLRADYRDNVIDRSVQWVTSPSVSMEYQWRRHYGLKFEAGGEWVNRELSDQASSDSSYFVTLGYKASF